MADISTGPDFVARIMGKIQSGKRVLPGEQPPSSLEEASEKLAGLMRECRAVATATGGAVKGKLTITIDVAVKGGDDLASPIELSVGSKAAPPAWPKMSRAGYVDDEGDFLGGDPRQTEIKVVTEAPVKPARKAV